MRAVLYLFIIAGFLYLPCVSGATEINTYGTTLLRYEDHTIGAFEKQRFGVGNQYLGLDLNRVGNGNLSISIYGWGRKDFGGDSGPVDNSNSELTYGYLKYRFPKSSSELTAGRFFTYGRGISSYIDGVSFKSDFLLVDAPGGVGLQFFSGTPVKTDHVMDNRGDFLTGGRIAYRLPNLFEIGAASLYEAGVATNGPDAAVKDYRNLLVGDVWFSPHRTVELTGHTSYNTVTQGVAENRYLINLRPLDRFLATLEYNNSTFKDLFSNSSQRSLFNPNSGDKVTSYGGSATYALFPFLDLSTDYRYSLRSGRTDSSRVGVGVAMKFAENMIRSGISWHRSDVGEATLLPDGFRVVSFNEVRGFIVFDNTVYSASIDTIADVYDRPIHGKEVGYELSGSLGYRLMPNVKLSCDLSMADNPQYSNEIRGVARLVFSHAISEKHHLDYRTRHAGDPPLPAVSADAGDGKAREKIGAVAKSTHASSIDDVTVGDVVELPGVLTETKPLTQVTLEKAGELLNKTEPLVEKGPPGVKTAVKPRTDTSYRIEIVNILSSSKANRLMAHLKSIGCRNVTIQAVEKELPMHRLFVAEFASLSTAKSELKKLRKIASGAFLLKSEGRYQLYAGSFRESAHAVTEQNRLLAYGKNIIIREGIRISTLFHTVTADIKEKSVAEKLEIFLKNRGMEVSLKVSNENLGKSLDPQSNITPVDRSHDRLQTDWLINELKKRGVDTSTILFDEDSDGDSDLNFHDAPLFSDNLPTISIQKSGDLLSEVTK